MELKTYLDLIAAKYDQPQCLVIGAMDGKSFDPLYPYIKDKEWPATLLEPLVPEFKKLERTYDGCDWVNLVNVAIGLQNSEMIMYSVNPEYYQDKPEWSWMEGISTLQRNVGDITSIPDSQIKESYVSVRTMDWLFEKHPQSDINILMIDTEGYDAKILKQFPFDRIQPDLVIMEFIHTSVLEYRQVIAWMRSWGYDATEIGGDVVFSKGI